MRCTPISRGIIGWSCRWSSSRWSPRERCGSCSYAVLYWLTLLFATVSRGIDATLPEMVPTLFIYSAGLLLLLTWAAHRRRKSDLPRDHMSRSPIALDIVLAVPRATLAVWTNLTAWQNLSANEIALAAELLLQLEQERRIPMHRVPLEIPDDTTRSRVLLALQITELLRLQHTEEMTWLVHIPGRLALENRGRNLSR